MSYHEFIVKLTPGFAPMQIYGMQIREAEASGRLREAAADCLARTVIERTKRRGWWQGQHSSRVKASCYATWSSRIKSFAVNEEQVGDRLKAVWKSLEGAVEGTSWCPEGFDDIEIKNAFDREWLRAT